MLVFLLKFNFLYLMIQIKINIFMSLGKKGITSFVYLLSKLLSSWIQFIHF